MRGSWRQLRGLSTAALAAALAPTAAHAGAWTQPAGEGQATLSIYGWTGSGSQSEGAQGPKQNEVATQLYLEYGLVDRVTLIGSMSLERYSILSPTNDTYVGPDYSQIGLQYQFGKVADWVFSGSASYFIPGATDKYAPTQYGNTGGAAEARLLAGRSFSIFGGSAFVDIEAAYRDRTNGPPNEFLADFTVGYRPNDKWTLMLQSFNEVTQGAGAPGFPQVVNSVEQASVTYALTKDWSLQGGVFGSAIAVGTNTEIGATMAITNKF